jgi:hypothetical protein
MLPWQTELFPLIVPGCDGTAFTVTASVCAGLLPQLLFAVTEIFPPLAPTVAVMELVDELPVHPDGSVHV